MPRAFVAAVAASASSTDMPATNRPDRRRPIAERSATARSMRLSERAMKNARNMRPGGAHSSGLERLRHRDHAHAGRPFDLQRGCAGAKRLAGRANVVDDENPL